MCEHLATSFLFSSIFYDINSRSPLYHAGIQLTHTHSFQCVPHNLLDSLYKKHLSLISHNQPTHLRRNITTVLPCSLDYPSHIAGQPAVSSSFLLQQFCAASSPFSRHLASSLAAPTHSCVLWDVLHPIFQQQQVVVFQYRLWSTATI